MSSPPGTFNPTRTNLLKTFKLDEPIVKGSGHRLYDARGREYLDFLAQYGAVPFGQNPPELWDILRRAETEQMVSMIQPLIPIYAQQLAERLGEITPGDLEVCIFTNSGAEAVEAAIKLARVRTGRSVILSTRNSFHGKTLGALSATGRPKYQKPFGAPVPNFDHVAYGDVDALAKRLHESRDTIAAFIVEPIQGEGGVVAAPEGYLEAAFELCRRHGVLTIVDEIQTGLGRTGALFATPAAAGTPDILLLAKALGGGLMPIGACVARREVWDDRFGLLHSSTFANNNLACRIGLGVIDLLLRDNARIIRHVAEQGSYLLDRLRDLQAAYPTVIKSVRGKGYMAGVEFHPFSGLDGSGTLAYASMNEVLVPLFSAYLFNAHRIVTAPTFNSSHVLRLQPPFTVGRPEIDRLLSALGDLCDALERVDCYQLVHHFVDSAMPGAQRPRRGYSANIRRSSPSAPTQEDDGGGGKFGFVLHYMTQDDVVRSDPSFAAFTDDEFERWKQWGVSVGPGVVHRVQGIQSAAGSAADGWIIVVPMLPRDMLQLGREESLEVLRRARELAVDHGATVLGLGGFTSIISRGGQDLSGTDIAITNGNTLTSVMTVTAVEEAARKTGLDLTQATVAIVGATGSIGRLVALLLATRVAAITLIGNQGNPDALQRCLGVADEIRALTSARVPDIRCSVELGSAAHADVVIAATNADTALVSAEHLTSGTIVVDVAQPPNVTAEVGHRRDVLVFDGGLVQLPQPITLGPVEGLPPGVCWGCLGETILLALEGEAADTTTGPDLTLGRAAHITRLAEKHGLRSAPLQRFGCELSAADFVRFSGSLAERNRTRPAQPTGVMS